MGIQMLKYVAIVLLSFLAACQTNPPTDSNSNVVTGKVVITSSVDSAKIYIDDEFTSLYTPDSLNLIPGNYTISVQKDNYISSPQTVIVTAEGAEQLYFDLLQVNIAKVVLLEDFANTSCAPCVESNKIIEELKETYPERLVSVKFPTNFPGPNDPFYLAGKTYCDFRRSYYNVLFAPTIVLDGTVKPIPTDKADITQKVESLLNTQALFAVNVAGSVVGSSYKINVELEIPEITGLNFSEMVLYAVITETNIQFAAPNGETEFFDVMRTVLPSNDGQSLSNVTQSGKYSFNFEQTLDPQWNSSNINVVAYVQNSGTKEIYQAGSNH